MLTVTITITARMDSVRAVILALEMQWIRLRSICDCSREQHFIAVGNYFHLVKKIGVGHKLDRVNESCDSRKEN
jgi:hypothetical protein